MMNDNKPIVNRYYRLLKEQNIALENGFTTLKSMFGALSLAVIVIFSLNSIAASDNGMEHGVIKAPGGLPIIWSKDIEPPVISILGANPLNIPERSIQTYVDAGATAIDNVDGNVNITTMGSVNTQAPGAYQIKYQATDSQGNVANATRNVIITRDTTPPVISMIGATPLYLDQTPNINVSSFTNDEAQNTPTQYDTQLITEQNSYDPGATAIDNLDGVVSVTAESNVNMQVAGDYTIRYTASDLSGNVAELVRGVSVVELPPIEITPDFDFNIPFRIPSGFPFGDQFMPTDGTRVAMLLPEDAVPGLMINIGKTIPKALQAKIVALIKQHPELEALKQIPGGIKIRFVSDLEKTVSGAIPDIAQYASPQEGTLPGTGNNSGLLRIDTAFGLSLGKNQVVTHGFYDLITKEWVPETLRRVIFHELHHAAQFQLGIESGNQEFAARVFEDRHANDGHTRGQGPIVRNPGIEVGGSGRQITSQITSQSLEQQRVSVSRSKCCNTPGVTALDYRKAIEDILFIERLGDIRQYLKPGVNIDVSIHRIFVGLDTPAFEVAIDLLKRQYQQNEARLLGRPFLKCCYYFANDYEYSLAGYFLAVLSKIELPAHLGVDNVLFQTETVHRLEAAVNSLSEEHGRRDLYTWIVAADFAIDEKSQNITPTQTFSIPDQCIHSWKEFVQTSGSNLTLNRVNHLGIDYCDKRQHGNTSAFSEVRLETTVPSVNIISRVGPQKALHVLSTQSGKLGFDQPGYIGQSTKDWQRTNGSWKYKNGWRLEDSGYLSNTKRPEYNPLRTGARNNMFYSTEGGSIPVRSLESFIDPSGGAINVTLQGKLTYSGGPDPSWLHGNKTPSQLEQEGLEKQRIIWPDLLSRSHPGSIPYVINSTGAGTRSIEKTFSVPGGVRTMVVKSKPARLLPKNAGDFGGSGCAYVNNTPTTLYVGYKQKLDGTLTNNFNGGKFSPAWECVSIGAKSNGRNKSTQQCTFRGGVAPGDWIVASQEPHDGLSGPCFSNTERMEQDIEIYMYKD